MDNMAVGGGSGSNPFGSSPGPSAEVKADGPLEEILVSKNWKVRNAAYKKLTTEFKMAEDEKSKVYSKYTSFFKKMLMDTNPAAQAEATEAIKVYVDRAYKAKDHADDIMPHMIKKCFASNKAQTKQNTMEIISLFFELGCGEAATKTLLKGMKEMNVKIVIRALEITIQSMKEFGPRHVQYSKLVGEMPKLFNHKKGGVRDLVQALACEVYGFVGKIFHDQVNNFKGMRKASLDAIDKAFQSITPGGSKPLKRLRSEQGAVGGAAGGAKQKKKEEDDPFSFIEAADITKDLSKNWLTEVMAPKWKDKKAKLEELLKLAGAPKIKFVPMYNDIAKCLKKLLKDSNILVRSFSIKCYEALAKGLRKDFKNSAEKALENLIPWFKEKKMSVLIPLNATMDAFFNHCLKWGDFKEPLLEAFKNKVPQVRNNTLKFCIRAIKSPKCDPGDLKKNMFKALIGGCLALSADKDKDVRKSAIECAACLLYLYGERAMYPTLAKIEQQDKKKCEMIKKMAKEIAEKEGGPAAAASAPAAPAPAVAIVSTPDPPEEKKAKPSRPASRAGKKSSPAKRKPRSARSVGKSPSKPTKSSASKSSSKSKPVSVPAAKIVDYDAAKEQLGDVLGSGLISNLESKKWKERLGAVTEILDKVNGEEKEEIAGNVGLIFSLFNKKPGWKDTNFQVCMKVYETCAALVGAAPDSATKALCLVPIEDVLNKMSDRKIEAKSSLYLTVCAETHGPKFLLPMVKEKLKKVKNPKAIAGAVKWVTATIKEFGAGAMNVQQLIDYAKDWIGHTNKDVRANSIAILVEIYKQTGKILLDKMKEGLKSSVASDLQKRFDKIPPEEVGKSNATRAVKGQEIAAEVKMDDIVPRVDISSQVNDKILGNMNDKKWQSRKQAMEDIEGIVRSANGRIKGKDGGAFSALKLRLSDKNKNLISQALRLIAMLIEAMGKPSGKYVGAIAEAILTCFADRKAAIRDEAVKTLVMYIKHAGLSKLVPYLPKGLEIPNARKDLIAALIPAMENEKLKKSEMKEFVVPMLKCLLDRTKEVRALAEGAMKPIIDVVGIKFVIGKTSGFKKAEKLTLDPVLQKLRGGDLLDDAPADAKESSPAKGKSRTKSPTKSSRSARGKSATSSSKKGPAPESELCDMILKCPSKDKARRAKKDARRMKGNGDLDPNEIEDMKEGIMKYTTPEFHKQLLAKDFTKFGKAIDKVQKALAAEDQKVFDKVIGILDLVFKFVAFRLCDGKVNTKVLKSLLRFLKTLMGELDANQYEMLDGEAKNLLPFLLEKVSGHSMAPMREACHDILQKMCNIYPASKVINELEDALDSKSKKVQAECLVEIGSMIARFGINVSAHPKKTVMIMGKAVGTSDKGVREAALTGISHVYQALNCDKDKIWKYFGGKGTNCKLPKKNQTMITERIKRVKPLPPKPKMEEKPAPAPHREAKSEPRGNTYDEKSENMPGHSGPHETPQPSQGSGSQDHAPAATSSSVDIKSLGLSTNAFSAFTLGDFSSFGGASKTASFGSASNFGGQQQSYAPQPAYGYQEPQPASPTHQGYGQGNPGFGGGNPGFAGGPGGPYGPQGGGYGGQGYGQGFGGPQGYGGYAGQMHPEQGGYAGPPNSNNPDVLALDAEDVDDKVEALRQIWIKVQEQGAMVYAVDADALVEKVAFQIQPPYQMRLCKYALNTLMEFWQNLEFSASIGYETLKNLTRLLLSTLLDQTLRDIKNGDKVMKALNVLTLKVLENAKRTMAFCVLIDLLGESMADGLHANVTDLVGKCLLKITKVLSQTINHIDVPNVIERVDMLFSHHPPVSGDPRFQTVNRLVEELCKLEGKQVRDIAMGMRGPNSYLVHMCNDILGLQPEPEPIMGGPAEVMTMHGGGVMSMSLHGGAGPSGGMEGGMPMQQQQGGMPMQQQQGGMHMQHQQGGMSMQHQPANRVTSPGRSPPNAKDLSRKRREVSAKVPKSASKDPRSNKVAILFKRLHQTDKAKQALEELFYFRNSNRDYDLSPHMSMVSRAFQAWIQRGFKRIEERKSRQGSSYGTTAHHYQERLMALKARAAKIKDGSYGSLSYSMSPARPQGYGAATAPYGRGRPESKMGGHMQNENQMPISNQNYAQQGMGGGYGSKPPTERQDSLNGIRARLANLRK